IARRPRNDRLNVMNEFVTDESYPATGETWQTGHPNGSEFPHLALDHCEPVFHLVSVRALRADRKSFDYFAILQNFDLVAGLPDASSGTYTPGNGLLGNAATSCRAVKRRSRSSCRKEARRSRQSASSV